MEHHCKFCEELSKSFDKEISEDREALIKYKGLHLLLPYDLQPCSQGLTNHILLDIMKILEDIRSKLDRDRYE